jgi:HlyD family secretion protein
MLPTSGPPVNDLPHASPPLAISPEATGPAAAGARRRADRQLGDRVRSLSLAHLPEQRNLLVTLVAWMIGLAVVGVGAWYLYGRFASPAPTDEPPLPSASAPARSTNEAPHSGPSSTTAAGSLSSALPPAKGDIVLEAKGYIVPAHQILVSPKVSGMIVTLDVEEGRRVNKGDVLAVLESIDYQADFERTKATARLARERLRELENGNRPEEINQSQAELREAEAQLVQLEAEFKRTEELRKRNANTQQEFELTQSKALAQKQRVERLQYGLKLMQLGPREERIGVAKAELSQAEADVKKAEWRLGNCTIRAPISGTILKKNAEEGNIVNPIAFNGSFSLCEMADLSDLEVDLDIQERDIAQVQVGQLCRVRSEAYPRRIYQGHVDRLMPIADRAKGAIPVRVKIAIPADEEGVYLKPEMGAIVTFLNERVSPPPAEPLESPVPAPAGKLPIDTR